jgi:hypothetical protein
MFVSPVWPEETVLSLVGICLSSDVSSLVSNTGKTVLFIESELSRCLLVEYKLSRGLSDGLPSDISLNLNERSSGFVRPTEPVILSEMRMLDDKRSTPDEYDVVLSVVGESRVRSYSMETEFVGRSFELSTLMDSDEIELVEPKVERSLSI